MAVGMHDSVSPGGVIRVVLADDHSAVRAGLRVLLGTDPDIEVIGEAATGADAVTRTHQLRPDVVLMDVQMPVLDGMGATAQIRAETDARVLILTTFGLDDYVEAALAAGADGFLLKSARAEEITGALHRVMAGDVVLAPEITRAVVERSRRAPAAPDPRRGPKLSALTPREHDVLELLGRGASNGEIARALGITEATAKSHVSRILDKLGVRSRVQAALLLHTENPAE